MIIIKNHTLTKLGMEMNVRINIQLEPGLLISFMVEIH